MSLLERIRAEKHRYDAQLARDSPGDPTTAPPPRDLREALEGSELSWIAEVKRRSPSRGEIR